MSTVVVVLKKQTGLPEVHSQPVTPYDCYEMQRLFRELKELGEPLILTTLREPAERSQSSAFQANGEAIDWTGAAVTSDQVPQFADELIVERKK